MVNNNNKTGRSRRSFTYEREMEDIFGKNATSNPEMSLDTSVIHTPVTPQRKRPVRKEIYNESWKKGLWGQVYKKQQELLLQNEKLEALKEHAKERMRKYDLIEEKNTVIFNREHSITSSLVANKIIITILALAHAEDTTKASYTIGTEQIKPHIYICS
nr:unnamed protein product [Callosobruchus analis]